MTAVSSSWFRTMIVIVLPAVLYAQEAVQRPSRFMPAKSLQRYYHAKELPLPQRFPAKTFMCGEQKGNFTYFSPGVENLRVADGVLKFRMGSDQVLLGWGNYGGDQPLEDRVTLWELYNDLALRVRQSTPAKTTWTYELWRNGKRAPYHQPVQRLKAQRERRMAQGITDNETTLEGTDWQEISLSCYFRQYVPDGFDLTIDGRKGTEIEIEWVKIIGPRVSGYFRKEIALPAGKVWRAVANVSGSVEVWVNGEQVDRTNGLRMRQPEYSWNTSGVDLAPFLKPGERNCIAFYGIRPGPTAGHRPFFYLQGRVVMESGAILPFSTDATWSYSLEEVPGWNRVGCEAGDWQQPRPRDPSYAMLAYGGAPAYSGPVLMENPGHRQLFYDAAKPVQVRLRVPRGFASKTPVLYYQLRRETLDAGSDPLAEGRTDALTVSGDSASATVDLGALDRGVYGLAVTLELQGKMVEQRAREPIVVAGHIPMEEVAGTSYTEGMDLELEDTIDFTDPDDPHPWVESLGGLRGGHERQADTPRIVKRGELHYRETNSDERSAAILTRIRFEHPGDLYLVELTYPNDKTRFIGISVSKPPPFRETGGKKTKPRTYASEAGRQIVTGVKFPLTDTMRTDRFLVVAEQGWMSLDIVSGMEGSPAAAGVARLYHVKGTLPALRRSGKGERLVGIHTERTFLSNGFTRTFGQSHDLLRAAWQREPATADSDPMVEHMQRLILSQKACENYVQYLRFTGQNFHVMGVYQYSDMNTPYEPPLQYPTSRVTTCLKSMLAELFRSNGIRFMAGTEFTTQRQLADSPLGSRSDGDVAQGADTVWPVDRHGRQVHKAGRSSTLNFAHPAVRKAFGRIVDDQMAKFGDNPNFMGIHHLLYVNELFLPCYHVSMDEPFEVSYDDVTFAAFERATGLQPGIAVDDPDRFAKRYAYVMQDEIKPRWTEFRCQLVRNWLLEVRDRLRAVNPEWALAVMLYVDVPHMQKWATTGMSYADFFAQFGFAPNLFREDEHLWFGRWMVGPELHHALRYGNLYGRKTNYASYWEQHVSPEVLKLYDRDDWRGVLIMNQWDEVGYGGPGNTWETMDWVLRTTAGRFAPQGGGDDFKEVFAQAMIGTDPDLLVYGFTDALLNIGGEQALREYTRVVTRLPREKFRSFDKTGFDTNLAIRELRRDDDYLFYIVNPGYWPVTGTVELNGKGKVVDLANDTSVTLEDGRKLRVSLPPWGIAAFRVDSGDARIEGWDTESIEATELTHLNSLIERPSSLMDDRRAAAGVTPRERRKTLERMAEARSAVGHGRVARAWSVATDWRSWSLAEAMETARHYAAFLPGAGSERPTLHIVRTAEPPVLDGRLDEGVWRHAPEYRRFVTKQNRPSLVETSVRAVYDRDAVYLGFQCADPDPDAIAADSDKFSFRQDVIALFLQPDETQAVYYQLAFNAADATFNQRVMGGQRDYDYRANWSTAAVRTEFGWTAEVRIGFDSFPTVQERRTGRWRVNLHRAFRGGQVVPPCSFSHTPGSWHDTDCFAPALFDPA